MSEEAADFIKKSYVGVPLTEEQFKAIVVPSGWKKYYVPGKTAKSGKVRFKNTTGRFTSTLKVQKPASTPRTPASTPRTPASTPRTPASTPRTVKRPTDKMRTLLLEELRRHSWATDDIITKILNAYDTSATDLEFQIAVRRAVEPTTIPSKAKMQIVAAAQSYFSQKVKTPGPTPGPTPRPTPGPTPGPTPRPTPGPIPRRRRRLLSHTITRRRPIISEDYNIWNTPPGTFIYPAPGGMSPIAEAINFLEQYLNQDEYRKDERSGIEKYNYWDMASYKQIYQYVKNMSGFNNKDSNAKYKLVFICYFITAYKYHFLENLAQLLVSEYNRIRANRRSIKMSNNLIRFFTKGNRPESGLQTLIYGARETHESIIRRDRSTYDKACTNELNNYIYILMTIGNKLSNNIDSLYNEANYRALNTILGELKAIPGPGNEGGGGGGQLVFPEVPTHPIVVWPEVPTHIPGAARVQVPVPVPVPVPA